MVGPGVAVAAVAPEAARCATRAAAAPGELDPWRCFHRIARRGTAPSDAVRALDPYAADPIAGRYVRLVRAMIALDHGPAADAAPELERSVRELVGVDADAERLARLSLAVAYRKLGKYDVAAAEIALAPTGPGTSDSAVAEVLAAECRLAYVRSLYDDAIDTCRAARAALPASASPVWRARIDAIEGFAMFESQRIEPAIALMTRAAEALAADGDLYAEADLRFSLARAAGSAHTEHAPGGEPVFEFYRKQLARAKEAAERAHHEVAQAHVAFHMALDPRIDVRDQLERLRFAERMFARFGMRGALADCRLWISDILRSSRPGDTGDADRMRDDAIELARTVGSPWFLVRGLQVRADDHWLDRDYEGFLEDSAEALAIMEHLHDVQRGESTRAQMTVALSRIFTRAIGRTLRVRDALDEAVVLPRVFDMMERHRARVLLSRLDRAAPHAGAMPAPDAAYARRERILDDIARVRRRLDAPEAADDACLLGRQRLAELERAERALRVEIARERPVFERLRPIRFASLEEIREELEPHEAMLAFQVAKGRTRGRWAVDLGGSWCLVVTRDAVDVVELPERSELQDAMTVLAGLLDFETAHASDPDGAIAAVASAALHDRLLAPVFDVLPETVTDLVVIPDGPLHDFPVETLRDASDGAPAAARYAFSHVPSATMWLRWRRSTPRPAERALAALADPRAVSTRARSEYRDAFATKGIERSLPHARREARTAVRRAGVPGTARLGARASERWVKSSDARRYAILHFATHAFADAEHPERSAVILSPGGDGEDGHLETSEIIGLDFTDRLVVLSACDSARGEVLGGEGPHGLARAFFLAGARAVVATVRPVRDDHAAALMDDFYRAIAAGESVGAALARAKRARIAAGATAAAWGSIVSLGDGSFVPLPGGVSAKGDAAPARSVAWLVVPAGLAMLVLAIAAARRRPALAEGG